MTKIKPYVIAGGEPRVNKQDKRGHKKQQKDLTQEHKHQSQNWALHHKLSPTPLTPSEFLTK